MDLYALAALPMMFLEGREAASVVAHVVRCPPDRPPIEGSDAGVVG